MITFTFDYVCDGSRILPKRICMNMVSTSPSAKPDERAAWWSIRSLGWHEAKWKGKTRHLCPVCWDRFLEK